MKAHALLPQPETTSEEGRAVSKLAGAACWAAMYVGVTVGQVPQHLAPTYRKIAEPFTPFQHSARPVLDVAAIRRASGMSWQQIADAVGVSRRSAHYWANGGNIAKLHRDRLQQLADEIDHLSYLDPETMRARLTERDSSGHSFIERMVSSHRPPPTSGPSAVDRMSATVPEPAIEQLGSSGSSRPSRFNPTAR